MAKKKGTKRFPRGPLPNKVVMSNWPRAPYGMNAPIDYSISAIDSQMALNNPSKHGLFKPKKY